MGAKQATASTTSLKVREDAAEPPKKAPAPAAQDEV